MKTRSSAVSKNENLELEPAPYLILAPGMLPKFSREYSRDENILIHSSPCHQCSPSAWWTSHQGEQEHSPPVDSHLNGQISSQIMGQPSTPGTPSSDPPTPHSPNYVNINNEEKFVSTTRSYASLIPLNATSVDSEVDEGIGSVSYVAYVENSAEHPLFNTHSNPNLNSNGENMAYPVYTVSENGGMYSTGTTAQYYSSASQPISYAHAQQDGSLTYLVPSPSSSTNNNNSKETTNLETVGQASCVTHTTRVSPATVQWLLDNYETTEGVSLPRSTLYFHYMRHCSEQKLDPVNAASFGKLIRSVFLGLRTRRLGTRGNSKYHYYGIRLKPSSALNAIDERVIEEIMGGGKGGKGSGGNVTTKKIKGGGGGGKIETEIVNGLSTADASFIQHYLGNSSHVMSTLPEMDINFTLPQGLVQDDLIIFHTLYRELCSQLVEDVKTFQLAEFQRRWRVFFRAEVPPSHLLEQQEYENLLSKSKLMALLTLPQILDYVKRTDYQLYQNFSLILIPDVLRQIPSLMTQAIRNFSKGIESCLASALADYPDSFTSIKIAALSSFTQTLRRYTSLNHLAQAARAVLQNEAQINQMLSDLNRVDFVHVEEQATWVCGCTGHIFSELESDFKSALSHHQSLENWAAWLESVVSRILRPYEGTDKYPSFARYFLLKWSFYSSLVIRDLTLRSAASFGSFHLLRLLYDEYVFYLVENRVAQATNTFPIAIMGQKTQNPLQFSSNGHENSVVEMTMERNEEINGSSSASGPIKRELRARANKIARNN